MAKTCFTFEDFCDDLGPIKIVHLYEPSCGLRGMVVIDNVACGPAIGGSAWFLMSQQEKCFGWPVR